MDSGDDAVYTTINFDTSLALVAGLHQAGWDGTFISPTGYGADLLGSQPAVQTGQGVIFSNSLSRRRDTAAATQEAARRCRSRQRVRHPRVLREPGLVRRRPVPLRLEKAGCDTYQAG